MGLLTSLADLLMPPRCGGCGRLGHWLCPACRAAVRRLEEPLCPRCGAELEFKTSRCPCRHRLRAVARIRSAAAYEGPVERAIHRLKYEGRRQLAAPLASLLGDRLAVDGLGAELILAVPLHPRRLRQRGFNQSELIAAALRESLRSPGRPSGRLVRVRDTPPQVGLDRLSRQDNVRGAFIWSGEPLRGEAVAVVDDVTTTGATLEACAAGLRAAGAGPVIGLSIAHVRI